MPAIFVHLSDIHFGQDVGKSSLHKHKDIKERLIEDVGAFFAEFNGGKATGVLLAGDLAYKGKPAEYQEAGEWLDRLTVAAGCEPHAVQIIPGNHDIDRDKASSGVGVVLDHIDNNPGEFTDFLRHEIDRNLLFGRFHAYSEFAEAYDCSVDEDGGPVGVWRVPIGSGRTIKILGLNSSILCRQREEKGRLLLGPNQTVISPPRSGEFLVIMIHHPLDWLRDGSEAMEYIAHRASVLITGHEHKNKCVKSKQILRIDAGAVIPPVRKASTGQQDKYGYSYNIIEFASEGTEEVLTVTVHTRVWSERTKRFISGKESRQYSLQSRPSQKRYTTTPGNPERHIADVPTARVIYKFFRLLKPDYRTMLLNAYDELPAERSTHKDRQALNTILEDVGAEAVLNSIDQLLAGPEIRTSAPKPHHRPGTNGRLLRRARRKKTGRTAIGS